MCEVIAFFLCCFVLSVIGALVKETFCRGPPTMDTENADIAYVKCRYPNAVCVNWKESLWKVYKAPGTWISLSSSFSNPEEAWFDAALAIEKREQHRKENK